MTSHRARLQTHQHTTTTATQSNTSKNRDYTKRTNKSRRSTAAHRGIVINRGGPAGGRPRNRATHGNHPAIFPTGFMIIAGWSGC